MAVSQQEIDRIRDLFAPLGDLTTRKMFGGLGIYHAGQIFAILMSDGTLRLKAQGDMITRMRSLGCQQWTYQRPGQNPAAMPYWTLPETALDDPEEASALARDALTYL